nr:uncharacterized protein LOC123765670 [Procambarus clarkii]
MLMRSSDGQLKRHRIIRLCSSTRCVEVTEGGGGEGGHRGAGGRLLQEDPMKTMVAEVRAASYHPTLPPEIATDAAIYVAVIVVFYAAIILLLVGTNLHRLRRKRRNHFQQTLQQQQQHQRTHHRPVDTTATAPDAHTYSFFGRWTASSATTSLLTQKDSWSDQDGAVVV